MKQVYFPQSRKRARLAWVAVAASLALVACGGDDDDDDDGGGQTVAAPTLSILSSKPEYVSGGDALIGVKLPDGATIEQVKLQVNGGEPQTPVSWSAGADGAYQGLLTGLKEGENVVSASVPNSAVATLDLTNYPLTGPMLSGPHMKPYECRTKESGLGDPLDGNCTAARRIAYYYRAADNQFKPLPDPSSARPADLVTTTTNDGKTVPYIVRVESGTVNRAIFRIAMLDDPSADSVDPAKYKPSTAWNRKVVVSFGGGAGTQYNQGTNQETSVLDHVFLSRGFAHINSTELVNQQHGNGILQGEHLMMLKEWFIERYGVPKWTSGAGGSGGAIQQQVITQIFPGLLDGIQPSAAFPDSTLHTPDCGLFQNFHRTKTTPGTWTAEKRQAVEGLTVSAARSTCAAWESSFVPVYTATNAPGCALNNETLLYDPIKNPTGARCTVQDMRVNIYGRQPDTGFARKPQDNVGLQYGWNALLKGQITTTEFIELNAGMGGNDIDGNFIDERNEGDPIALKAVYESGLLNSGGGGLANVPILHYRGYTDMANDIHSRERDLTIRARLQRALKRSDHQVIWVGPPSGFSLKELAMDTMNEWLDNMAADPAALNTDKVVRNKPAAAVDSCFDAQGVQIKEVASMDGTGTCNTMYPPHSEPRLVAGAPLANDILKCALKPIDFATDYPGITFTSAEQSALRAIFPTGICDWSKPGIEQVPLKTTYPKY